MIAKRQDADTFIESQHAKAVALAAESLQQTDGCLQVQLELDFIEM